MWEEIIHLLKNNIQGGDVDLSKLLDEEILRLGGFFRGTCCSSQIGSDSDYQPIGDLAPIVAKYKELLPNSNYAIFATLVISEGIGVHSDIENVLLHQLEGEMRYDVYRKDGERVIETDEGTKTEAVHEKVNSVIIKPGETLFITAGGMHFPKHGFSPRATLSFSGPDKLNPEQVTYHWNDLV